MDQAGLYVLLILVAVPAFYFFAERRTGWGMWTYLPPLLWIYATPLLLRLIGLLPDQSPVYAGVRAYLLPLFITLLVMTVDLKTVARSLGRGLPVVLVSTLCVMVTAPLGYLAASAWLPPQAWLGFGALAGSWIGGTANMAAMEQALGTPPDQMGLAILADQSLSLIYLPLMIVAVRFTDRFNAWIGARPIDLGPEEETAATPQDAEREAEEGGRIEAAKENPGNARPDMADLLTVVAVALANVAVCSWVAARLPELPPFISGSTWLVLLVTTGAILLSFTPIRRSQQAPPLGSAILYVFVANMGASASLAGFAGAPAFLFGTAIWLALAMLLAVIAAKLMRTDLRIAVLALTANIGGVASNPVVAAAYDRRLVPVALMMAMICYVYANYAAIVTGHLVRIVAGG
ncbi:MAG TPA: DUF819 family protein [Allosphingosinicella sp.]